MMMLTALSACSGAANSTGGEILNWHSFDEGLASAREDGRYVFVNVYAPWCGWCQKMKEEVYTDARVASYLKAYFERVHVNYDDTESTYDYRGRELTARRLAQTLKVRGVPALVILNSDGQYLMHLSGFIGPQRLLPVLRYIASGRYERESYEVFLRRTSATDTLTSGR